MQAIEYEARRQIELIEEGGTVEQQTRLFDSTRGETRPMRSKEHAHDYRYFPDPDLLPLVLDPAWIEELRAQLPELPDAKKARFIAEYGLRPEDAGVLVAERATAEYFEKIAQRRDAKAAAYWVIGDLFGALNKKRLGIEQSPVAADRLGGLIDLITDGTISGRIAKACSPKCRDRRRPRRDRRGEGAAPGDGPRGDRGCGRCGARRPPRSGRAIRRQPEGPRLLRRPGHESDPRQGQPRPRQRAPAQEAGGLTSGSR
jgi:Asp-tRNA(Asn)/Glu-tRNA(Gln) amidotransferase B subunit